MYKIKQSTQSELTRVQSLIKKELASEKIIREIYEYIFNSEGKKTRALISLLASKSWNIAGSGAPMSTAIKNTRRIQLAGVIELLHTATLVHDDVVDESDLRRGSRSVNQVWTNSYSVLMGDFIYSKAFILMVKLNQELILEELAKATNDIAKGEIIQLGLFKNRDYLTLKNLLKVSYLKTGRLFEASAKTGAMLANRSNDEIKYFGLLGKALGIAFQIQDDILDYETIQLNTGKPALKDFREGKITFPLFYAIKNASKTDREFLFSSLGKEKLSKTTQRKIYDLVKMDKANQQTNALLEKYLKDSTKQLTNLKDHSCYDEMLNLISFLKIREK
jgi:octaprenyl-diphosphate synthase